MKKLLTKSELLSSLTAKDISYKKPSNTFRILCLGDSMLFGAGVNNDENLTYFLEKILNEKFKEITFEVINAGVPNWGPLEYYLFLKNEGYKYSPDLILISPSFDYMSAFPQDKIKFKNWTSIQRGINLIKKLHEKN